jgi:predicted dithiol-disulfide oxidoreductase (DUF899 family)
VRADRASPVPSAEVRSPNQALLWAHLPQGFELVSEKGPVRLSTLFNDKDTLMIYSMMYGPQRKTPCLSYTSFLTSWRDRCQPA